jgi:hypothetical protein
MSLHRFGGSPGESGNIGGNIGNVTASSTPNDRPRASGRREAPRPESSHSLTPLAALRLKGFVHVVAAMLPAWRPTR